MRRRLTIHCGWLELIAGFSLLEWPLVGFVEAAEMVYDYKCCISMLRKTAVVVGNVDIANLLRFIKQICKTAQCETDKVYITSSGTVPSWLRHYVIRGFPILVSIQSCAKTGIKVSIKTFSKNKKWN